MHRNDIKNMLAKQLDDKVGAFLKKKADYSNDLEKDLSQLRTTYGDKIVDAMVTTNGTAPEVTAAIMPEVSSRAVTSQLGGLTSNKAPVTKRKRRRRSRSRNTISFSDLKPQVVEAVKALTGKRFTIQDVKKILKNKKVKFDLKHLHLILPRYLSGIKVVDKQKRNGLPMNVYEVKGDVALVNYTVTSKTTTKK